MASIAAMRNSSLRPLLAPRKLAPAVTVNRTQCASYRNLENISLRWIGQVKRRIGKCLSFGLNAEQTRTAGAILKELSDDWRGLLAGSRGFLTGPEHRGLHRQKVVWGEMDSMGHVNNVAYIRYAESARVNWTMNLAKLDPGHRPEWSQMCTPHGQVGLILGSIKCGYKFPLKYPDSVTVYHRLRDPPSERETSFKMEVYIVSELHRRVAAQLEEHIVFYDYKEGKRAQLPPFVVAQFSALWKQQQAAVDRYGGRLVELDAQVRRLEQDSWDREGAVEDLGSAR